MSETDVEIGGKLTDRLRGKYRIGPETENGEPEFGHRQFNHFTPPIQLEAAHAIEALTEEKERLQEYVSDWRDKCVGLTDENKKLLERLEVVSKILEMHLDTNGAVNPENWEEQVELDEAFELLDVLSPRMPDQCGDHEWGHFVDGVDWESCRFCGKVRRADGKNKPCKGPVKVGPRGDP